MSEATITSVNSRIVVKNSKSVKFWMSKFGKYHKGFKEDEHNIPCPKKGFGSFIRLYV
ncbi:MAG TPA: hypothetical protein VFM28_04000 [Nitrososphaeraceae archaeon]|nr:hypothetical protein [Nitrososphaeraceae archaeon]